MHGIKAVVFDMDGVLIDSEPIHFVVANQVLGAAGHALSREENEAFIGMTNAPFWAAMISRYSLPDTAQTYIAAYERALLRALEEAHSPQPGVIELIDSARRRGLSLAVASSSPRSWITGTLRSIGLSDAFSVIVSGDDVKHGKPDPAIYLLAAEQLSLTPASCLAIEDSPNGVQSAHRAGMYVIGVRTPYTAHLSLDGAGADRIVDSLCEVSLDD